MTTHPMPSKVFDSKTFTDTMAEVTLNVEEFLTNGVYVQYQNWGRREDDTYWPHFNRRRFMRAIAKENKRPFITAIRTFYPNYVAGQGVDRSDMRFMGRIVIPRRKYLAPVVSSLLLAAEKGISRHNRDVPVSVQGTSVATFAFHGDEGREHFENWLVQCRTNPEFRKALRLQ